MRAAALQATRALIRTESTYPGTAGQAERSLLICGDVSEAIQIVDAVAAEIRSPDDRRYWECDAVREGCLQCLAETAEALRQLQAASRGTRAHEIAQLWAEAHGAVVAECDLPHMEAQVDAMRASIRRYRRGLTNEEDR